MPVAKSISKLLHANLGYQHQEDRNYLGMSSIGRCPRQLYDSMVSPNNRGVREKWFSWTGYLHEAGIKYLLGAEQEAIDTLLGVTAQLSKARADFTVIAPFDERYRGHVDYILDDTLIEIKSTTWRRAKFFAERRQPDFVLFAQVQEYLHYTGLKRAVMVVAARDIPYQEFYEPSMPQKKGGPIRWYPPFLCFDIYPRPLVQAKLEEKAKIVLKALDTGERPPCACRKNCQ